METLIRINFFPEAGNTLYLSGVIGMDATTKQVLTGIEEQVTDIFKTTKKLLK